MNNNAKMKKIQQIHDLDQKNSVNATNIKLKCISANSLFMCACGVFCVYIW